MGKLGAFVLGAVILAIVTHFPATEAASVGLQFDGNNDYVTFGQATSTLGASNFTLEIWFKRTGAGQSANTGTSGLNAVPLLTKGRGETDGDARDMNYFLGIDTGGVLVADFEEGEGGSGPLGLNHPVIGHTATGTDTWYHAAVTYDGTSWSLYLNGLMETNVFVGEPARWDSIQHAALATAINSMGTHQGHFQGVLDEARIWDYARSAGQIAASMYQQIGSAPGLIARWSLNESSGTVAENSVPGAPNGTLLHGPVWCPGYPFPPGTNMPPAVALASPSDGATFDASTNLIINVNASDIDGTVANVALLRDGIDLGVVTNRPFSLIWSNVTAGAHSLAAVATDDGGLIATSAVVDITIAEINHDPVVEAVHSPAPGTNNVPLSPTLSVTVSDPETNSILVTFYGRLAPSEPDFTVVVLPDTQYYTRSYPSILQTQITWIINNRTNLNIVYLASLGDITDDGDCLLYEWINATNAMYRLEDPVATGLPGGIPYGMVPGNHDHLCGTTRYNTYFGTSHFAGRSYYGGNLGGNNQNHYDLISASGLDFVIVYLDFNYAEPDVNYPAIDAWANTVLQSNVNRRAIVVSHCMLDANGDFDGTRTPSAYSNLKGNTNLFLMLCGHNYREARRQDEDEGHTITTCLSDYQFDPNGGNGWLRLYQFSPTNNLVRVKTYSPYLGQYETDDSSQFEFGYTMDDSASYFVIGTTNISSGSTVDMTWPGLAPGADYQWYVTVNDGTNLVESATWRFTTTTTGTNAAPAVALVDPANGAVVLAGANITLTATASDVESVITRVDFLANGINVGSATDPYTLVWSNLVEGTYNLTAVAFDSGGLTATSTPVALIVGDVFSVTNNVIADGSIWKYLDNGSNLGTNWIGLTFDDSGWASGPSELGYGDAVEARPEATVVGYGPDPTNKYITTYFRHAFVVTNVASVAALNLRVIRDDGIVVYLNGTGVYTNNMPTPFVYDTPAPDTIDDQDEDTWQIATVPSAHLREGTNIVAVEIHQSAVDSDDISFNLELNTVVSVFPNLPPIADSQNVNMTADTTVALILSGSDLNGDPLSFVLGSSPAYGLISSFDAQTGAITYQPAHAFVGADVFQFVTFDGAHTSAPGAVTIQVLAAADSNTNGLPDTWETAHAVTDPDADDDDDGFTNRQEYEAGTDPHDATSALHIMDACLDATNDWFTITWSSVGGTRYRVCYSDGDADGGFVGQFDEIVRSAGVEIDVAPAGVSSTQTFTDDFTLTGGPPAHGTRYFRVKVAH